MVSGVYNGVARTQLQAAATGVGPGGWQLPRLRSGMAVSHARIISMIKSLLWTLASCIAFGVVGSLLGMTLGWQVPEYLEATYKLRRGPDSDLIKLGGWAGFKQGFVGGMIWYLVLSTLNTWSEQDSELRASQRRKSGRGQGWVSGIPLVFCWLLCAILLISLAYRQGVTMGGMHSYDLRDRMEAGRKTTRLGKVLLTTPFPNVAVRTAESPERVRIQGTLPDQAARDTLKAALTEEFGAEEAEQVLSDVRLESLSAQTPEARN